MFLQERWLRGPTEGGSVSAVSGLYLDRLSTKSAWDCSRSSLCQKRSKEWGDRGKVHTAQAARTSVGDCMWHSGAKRLGMAAGSKVLVTRWRSCFPGLLLEASKPIPLAARREEVGYRSHRRSSYKTRLRHELAERGGCLEAGASHRRSSWVSLFHWFIDWFIHSLLHSFIHACVHALMHWFIDFLIHWFADSLVHYDSVVHWFIDYRFTA